MSATHIPVPIRVVENIEDGREARHFTFEFVDRNDTPRDVQPGSFFMLNVPGAGESAFTYSSLPDADGRFGALVRRVGSVTTALFRQVPGAILGARGPFGHGWPVERLRGARTLVVGGGCGLAPLVSAVQHLSAHRERFAVVYSSRDDAARVLGRERAAWREKDIALVDVVDAQGRIGPVPHLDEAIGALGGEPDIVLTCGPEAMMFALTDALHARGMPTESIYLSLERRMHCGTGHCGHCYIGSDYCCTNGPVISLARLRPHASLYPQPAAT